MNCIRTFCWRNAPCCSIYMRSKFNGESSFMVICIFSWLLSRNVPNFLNFLLHRGTSNTARVFNHKINIFSYLASSSAAMINKPSAFSRLSSSTITGLPTLRSSKTSSIECNCSLLGTPLTLYINPFSTKVTLDFLRFIFHGKVPAEIHKMTNVSTAISVFDLTSVPIWAKPKIVFTQGMRNDRNGNCLFVRMKVG